MGIGKEYRMRNCGKMKIHTLCGEEALFRDDPQLVETWMMILKQ